MPLPNILKIGTKSVDNQPNELDLRIMYLTGLAVCIEGEEDKYAILVEAADYCSGDGVGCSGTAALTKDYEGLH